MHVCMLCVFSNECVCVSVYLYETGERGRGQRRRQNEEEEAKGGGSQSSQRGMGIERKRLTGPACTHHPNQLQSLISPSNTTSVRIYDLYIGR